MYVPLRNGHYFGLSCFRDLEGLLVSFLPAAGGLSKEGFEEVNLIRESTLLGAGCSEVEAWSPTTDKTENLLLVLTDGFGATGGDEEGSLTLF